MKVKEVAKVSNDELEEIASIVEDKETAKEILRPALEAIQEMIRKKKEDEAEWWKKIASKYNLDSNKRYKINIRSGIIYSID